MFTGLVREIGVLRGTTRAGAVTRLTVSAPHSAPDLSLGDSLACDGICLTVTALDGDVVFLDAVAETRRVTTLGTWRTGRMLHLEPALKAGDPLGGHLVLGHVDGVGELRRIRRDGESLRLTFAAPSEVRRWLLPKGSIAVDGVSLTVDEGPFDDGFTVSLIPHTLASTRFAAMKPGQAVNLEADVLAKGAEARAVAAADSPAPAPTLTVESITARGFRRRR